MFLAARAPNLCDINPERDKLYSYKDIFFGLNHLSIREIPIFAFKFRAPEKVTASTQAIPPKKYNHELTYQQHP